MDEQAETEIRKVPAELADLAARREAASRMMRHLAEVEARRRYRA